MTAAEPSPFAVAQPELARIGYPGIIPLIPSSVMHHAGRGKAPGDWVSGTWRGLTNWTRYRDSAPSPFQVGMWTRMPGAGAGMLLGVSAGGGYQVVAVDIDVTDADDLALLQSVLPASPMAKRGAKGLTLMYRADPTLKSRSYDRAASDTAPAERLIDLLAAGRQTVVPPTRHVEGMQYVWLRGPVPPSELPVLTEDALEKLEDTLETLGWVRDARAGEDLGERRPRGPIGAFDPFDPWSVAKAQALARLDEWVPALDLAGTRRARGGWEAIPHWRQSCSGRPLEDRKRNLSFSHAGIRDWGASGEDAGLTAIDVVQRALDLSASEALTWLQEKLGIEDDEGVEINLAPTGAEDKADLVDPSQGPDAIGSQSAGVHADELVGHSVPPEMPVHLLDCPGLVGEIAAWMGRTAQKPVPLLNLAAGLCIVATAAGRKFAGPTEAGLVCYFLGLSPTGSGKAHPIRAGVHLMNAAGMGRMVAPSSWMSGSALIQHLERQPACLSFADEVAEFLAKLSSAKASTHERAVSGNMRELWGINWGTYTPPGWASSRERTQPNPIHAPAYSVLGLSVPDAVWAALQGSDVTNGFLNRFICFSTKLDSVEQDPEESVFDVPGWLVERLRDLAAYGGALASATMHHDGASKPLVMVPWDGGPGSPAHQVFKDLRDYCRTQAESETLMKRTAEIAVRLATIRAIGIDGPDAKVTVADMEWARGVALWSAGRMITDAAAYMSETEWQAKAKFVLRCITDAPGGRITRAALCKRVAHRFPARDLDAIIKGLIEAEEVADNSSRSGKRGPGALTYVAL